MTHKEDFNTGSTAAVCGGITTVVDMPNTVPPTADAEQVKVKKELGEAKSLVDFGITGVVVQTNTKDILPMAAAGAIGYKIFFGETIGNLPFPDDGMCMEAFDYIAQSKLPLGHPRGEPPDHGLLHQQAENRRQERSALLGSLPARTSAKPSRCITRSSSPRPSAPSCMFSI